METFTRKELVYLTVLLDDARVREIARETLGSLGIEHLESVRQKLEAAIEAERKTRFKR